MKNKYKINRRFFPMGDFHQEGCAVNLGKKCNCGGLKPKPLKDKVIFKIGKYRLVKNECK